MSSSKISMCVSVFGLSTEMHELGNEILLALRLLDVHGGQRVESVHEHLSSRHLSKGRPVKRLESE